MRGIAELIVDESANVIPTRWRKGLAGGGHAGDDNAIAACMEVVDFGLDGRGVRAAGGFKQTLGFGLDRVQFDAGTGNCLVEGGEFGDRDLVLSGQIGVGYARLLRTCAPDGQFAGSGGCVG